MATYHEALALAERHYEQGHLEEAARLYEQVLQSQPRLPEVWHRLGGIYQQAGKLELAANRLRQALALQPDSAECLSDLGTVLQVQGQLPEAINCFQEAVRLRPGIAALHFNLGNVYSAAGKHLEALACYSQAVAIDAQFAAAHFNLGVTCKALGRVPEAIMHYRQAIRLNPQLAASYCNLGDALQAQGDAGAAMAEYERAIAIDPGYSLAHHNLGDALVEEERLPEALACYGRLLEQHPQDAKVYTSLGAVFQKLGRLDDAMQCYVQALQLNSADVRAYANMGTALQEQGRLQEAFACQCKALELAPDDVEAHVNRSLLFLLTGDFENGWLEYEWRWNLRHMQGRGGSGPRWEGEPLAGRTILLRSEQGLGDTIQFVRYASLLKTLGATVHLSCPGLLVNLMASCRSVDRVFSENEDAGPFDFDVPLLSVPRVLKTELRSVPADVPYLAADPALVEHWAKALGPRTGLRIGINWQGRSGFGAFRNRDIPLEFFLRLAEIPGVQLVSLQKQPAGASLAGLPIFDPGVELDARHGAFMDTAAIMMNLDLVISSDTAVPHLAGALGIPVWTALPFAPDWRWLLERSDSPWYPTMRLFRQRAAGDWAWVFEQIEAELKRVVASR